LCTMEGKSRQVLNIMRQNFVHASLHLDKLDPQQLMDLAQQFLQKTNIIEKIYNGTITDKVSLSFDDIYRQHQNFFLPTEQQVSTTAIAPNEAEQIIAQHFPILNDKSASLASRCAALLCITEAITRSELGNTNRDLRLLRNRIAHTSNITKREESGLFHYEDFEPVTEEEINEFLETGYLQNIIKRRTIFPPGLSEENEADSQPPPPDHHLQKTTGRRKTMALGHVFPGNDGSTPYNPAPYRR